MMRRGMVLVISGPSGVGKGTLAGRLLREDPAFTFSVSMTTRAPRPGETHGVHYWFVTEEEFARRQRENGFLETAVVHGHPYGTPRGPAMEAVEAGRDFLLDIDPQGARQVIEAMPDCVTVFILPPSMEELRRRLTDRGTETPAEVERRLANARGEIARLSSYRYVIVNDDLEAAYRSLRHIVEAERLRTDRNLPPIG